MKTRTSQTTTYRTSQLASQRKIKYELAFASCAIKLQSYCQHNFCLTATVITVVRCRAVTKLHHNHWLDKSVNSYLVLVLQRQTLTIYTVATRMKYSTNLNVNYFTAIGRSRWIIAWATKSDCKPWTSGPNLWTRKGACLGAEVCILDHLPWNCDLCLVNFNLKSLYLQLQLVQ